MDSGVRAGAPAPPGRPEPGVVGVLPSGAGVFGEPGSGGGGRRPRPPPPGQAPVAAAGQVARAARASSARRAKIRFGKGHTSDSRGAGASSTLAYEAVGRLRTAYLGNTSPKAGWSPGLLRFRAPGESLAGAYGLRPMAGTGGHRRCRRQQRPGPPLHPSPHRTRWRSPRLSWEGRSMAGSNRFRWDSACWMGSGGVMRRTSRGLSREDDEAPRSPPFRRAVRPPAQTRFAP